MTPEVKEGCQEAMQELKIDQLIHIKMSTKVIVNHVVHQKDTTIVNIKNK